MDHRYVTETWIFYGASDLYFSFYSEEWVFDHHSAFFAIMALEKHFKAFLLFYRSEEYASLEQTLAKKKIQSIAREYGHNFKKMANKSTDFLGTDELTRALDRDYDGYHGLALLGILQEAYMETRYPTDRKVSELFPLDEPGLYHDPLRSSGLARFVFEICQFLSTQLSSDIDFGKVLENLSRQYHGQEPFGRFKNMYMPTHWQESGA